MTTLFDMVLAIGEFISQDFVSSTATGGSATTLVDTKRTERDTMWNGGTLMIKTIYNGGVSFAGDKIRVVNDYDYATKTFTFDTIPIPISGAGTTYAAIGPDYPFTEILRGINQALLRINSVIRYDETTMVVDGQTVYDLPAGVSDDVRRVEVDTYETAPYYTWRHYYWNVINRKLVFDEGSEPDGDYRIRLYYNDPIDNLVNDADVLPADIPRKAWYMGGVYYCLKERLRKTKQSDAVIMALLGEAERDWLSALRDIKRMNRDPHLIFWGEA